MHNEAQLEVFVEEEDICVVACLESTLRILNTHDAGRRVGAHVDSIDEGDISLLHSGADEEVHRSDTTSES